MIKNFKNKLLEDKHLSELLKGSLVSLIFKILGMILGYIITLYITKIYGAKEFGILTLSLTIVSIFTLIPKFGMENALIRIIGELNSLKLISESYITFKQVFVFSSALSLIFAFILFYLSDFIATDILNKPNMAHYIKIISITVVSTTIITIISATYQGMKKIKKFVFTQMVLSQLIFLLFLLFNNYLITISNNIVIIYVYSNIITMLLSLYAIYKMFSNFKNKKRKKPVKFSLKNILLIAYPMLLSGSFTMIMSWADTIMLGIFSTETEIGIYNVAQRLAGLASISLLVINTIVAPKFVEFYSKKDIKGLQRIAHQSTKIIFFVSFPILVLYIFLPEFFMGIFGQEFKNGSVVLILIAIAQFVNAACGSVGYILQMTDNQKIFQYIVILSAILNIILNFLLIPIYGMNGAAFATMISIIVWNVSSMIYIKRNLGFWTFAYNINLKNKKGK